MLWWLVMLALNWLVSATLRIMSRCRTCQFFRTFYTGVFVRVVLFLFVLICFLFCFVSFFHCFFLFCFVSFLVFWYSTFRIADVILGTDNWRCWFSWSHVKCVSSYQARRPSCISRHLSSVLPIVTSFWSTFTLLYMLSVSRSKL